jgi:RNA polymerase sigma-70 factor (ECF subfamily)
LDEAELVERARNGDQRAFRDLYDANVERIYRLAFRMAGQDDLARDFTQETFVRAYEKLGQFRGDAAFSTWLHSIAVSVSLNGLRKVDRHRKRERDIEDAAHLGSSAAKVEPWLRERLQEAIDGLPEIYRTVFLMHDLEGFNHKEIAAALDVAEGTSKARLSRARAKLRESLGDLAREQVG